MKSKEILKQYRSKDLKILYKNLQAEYQKLQDLRFGITFHKVKKISQIRDTRLNIARILTIIREKISMQQK